jgi:hypothetical protein
VDSSRNSRASKGAAPYCVAIFIAGTCDLLANDCQQHARLMTKKPSPASIALALIPIVALCFSVPLWDRITPRVLGLPFNIFWIVAWLGLTPAVMSIVYRIEKRR